MKTLVSTVALAALLAAAALTAPASASAADKCLTGASTLGDQRAIAALRAAIDVACPCASFTGGQGNGRSAYRRCARQVRDAALASGELRRQCRMTGTRGYSDTTCGTTGRVACGRVMPTSKSRKITCRVKPADRCVDRGKYRETVCAAETHCSDVVDWTAGTCVDVRERAPFEAGVRVVTFTKTSVVNPAQERPLETIIWYPTSPGAGPVSSGYGAVIDAPLAAAAAPYPLLMFSHGSCGYPAQSIFLTALLATQGFVVVAPPHPGNTLFDFPTCGTPQAQTNSFLERPQDVVFVLDQMLAANADPLSPFFDAIDPERIGMSGHSFGGLTTYLVEDIDPRVKVAIPMAAAAFGSPSLDVPSLSMLGEIDSVVNNTLIRNAYAASSSPRYLVEIAKTGHYAFSDGCFPGPNCSPPATLTQPEAHDAVLRWVLPFLELHLNGDADFAPFFLTPPPGTTLSATE